MSLERLSYSYLNKKNKLFGFEEKINDQTFLPIKLTGDAANPGFANAMRRILISEVPTMAFDAYADGHVVIKSNTSQYHNEVLLDRFGFITLDSLKNYEDLIFTVCDPETKEPLKNKGNDFLEVTTHSHMCVQNTKTKEYLKISDYIVYDSLMLTLKPGEEIHMLMKASLGTGRKHIRWQSSVTMYKFATKFDKENNDHFESNDELLAYLGHEKSEPEAIILTIESVGKLPSHEVLRRGLEVFKGKLNYLKDNIKFSEKSDVVSVETDEAIPNLVKFRINGEDHTVGNAIQQFILKNLKKLINETEMKLILESLSSYRKPHPLTNMIELLVRTPQTEALVFPEGQFENIDNPATRLVLYSIETLIDLVSSL